MRMGRRVDGIPRGVGGGDAGDVQLAPGDHLVRGQLAQLRHVAPLGLYLRSAGRGHDAGGGVPPGHLTGRHTGLEAAQLLVPTDQ